MVTSSRARSDVRRVPRTFLLCASRDVYGDAARAINRPVTRLRTLSSIAGRLLKRRLAGSPAATLRAAVVSVDYQNYSVRLREKPVVGATIDVGFPVRVVESKDVAGGGLLIAAERVDADAASGAPR
jgi:hypothetical protein